MRHLGLIAICAIFSLSPIAPAISAAPSTPTYLISMEMRDGSEIVAQPRLKFKAGEPARIQVGSGNGIRYTMTVTAIPQADSIVSVATAIDVVSAGDHRAATTELRVKLGEMSVIEFGKDAGARKPIHIDFTLTQVAAQRG